MTALFNPPRGSQSGTGAASRSLAAKAFDTIDAADFVPAGVDRTAVNSQPYIAAAMAEAKATGRRVVGSGNWRTDTKVVVNCSADFSAMTVTVMGAPAIAWEISTGNGANPTDWIAGLEVSLPKLINGTKPGTGWAGQGTGFRIVNVQDSEIYVPKAQGFDVGLDLTAFSQGTSYNNIRLGALYNNRINNRCGPGNAGGWVNENKFYGGAMRHVSGEGVAVAGTRDIQIVHFAGGNIPNNNVWFSPALEGDAPEYHAELQGLLNAILWARWEATSPKLYLNGTPTNCNSNTVHGGYAPSARIAVTTAGTANFNRVTGFDRQEALSFAAQGFMLENASGSSLPVMQVFEAATKPYGKDYAATDYAVRLSSQTLEGKRAADAQNRILMDFINGRLYMGDASTSPTQYLAAFNSTTLGSSAAFVPITDNARTLGAAANRWSVVYAGTGTINTSDEAEKRDIEAIPAAWLAAWANVGFHRFKWKSAVAEKGDAARWHVGLIAQRVHAAFAAQGVDAFSIGLLCRDEITDETGATVQRWGVRYDQALAMECAYLRSRLA